MIQVCSYFCNSSYCYPETAFPWGGMNKIFSFVPLALALLLSACGNVPDEFRLPPQEYVKVLELNGRESGGLFGRILFPSAYTQRSVRFSLDDRTFITQPDGRFLIEGIPAGTHELTILVKNYEPIFQQFVIDRSEAVQAGPWRLKMARGKVIGRLVVENGDSAANVQMRLMPLGGMAKTDGDGIFQFIGVNSGSHLLRVTDSRFFTYNREFSLSKGEQRNLGNIKVFRKAGYNMSQAATMEIRKSAPPAVRGLPN